MIALLKNGKINTRLLWEMAVHKDFVKLLADIEIYVDGIASMQIQNLNTLVDMARVEITEKYQPGGEDTYIRLLNAAHIEEDTYLMYEKIIDNMNKNNIQIWDEIYPLPTLVDMINSCYTKSEGNDLYEQTI